MTTNYKAPIILIHGWGMNKQVWNGVLDALPEKVLGRTRALDMPGYGNNDQLPQDYSIEELAEWLNTEITEPSYIVGWSLGGLVAQQFAITFPEKVVSLGLVASSPKFSQKHDWPGIDNRVLDNFSSQLAIDHNKTIIRFLKIQAMGSTSITKDIKQLKEWIFSAPEPQVIALEKGLALLDSVDLREAMKSIQGPIFGIFGKLDSLVPVSAVERMSEYQSNCNFTILDKASHAPFISNKATFVKWLLAFTE